ncbi:MAG: conjugal transfer protein TraF [Legionellaceae bacterium]|nr:conjugal transfer protein TraF [Legionellaceae bacterium]
MKSMIAGLLLLLGAVSSAQAAFFDDHKVMFFFASTCPHCHKQAPVLKAWATDAGADIEAYSFDDQPLPEFPEVYSATQDLVSAAFKGEQIRYPALFIVHDKTGELYPVSVGALSESELALRMQTLIPKIIEHESRGVS